MSYIKYEGIYEFTEDKQLMVYWCLGDGDNGEIDDTYGLEIQVDEYHHSTDFWTGVNLFTFGYEPWSQVLWEKWGSYVCSKIQDYPQTEEGFEAAKQWIGQFWCMYTRDKNHLLDVEVLWELVNK